VVSTIWAAWFLATATCETCGRGGELSADAPADPQPETSTAAATTEAATRCRR